MSLVDESFVPASQRTSVLYCRLTDFCLQLYNRKKVVKALILFCIFFFHVDSLHYFAKGFLHDLFMSKLQQFQAIDVLLSSQPLKNQNLQIQGPVSFSLQAHYIRLEIKALAIIQLQPPAKYRVDYHIFIGARCM